jgi:hypothetical protein
MRDPHLLRTATFNIRICPETKNLERGRIKSAHGLVAAGRGNRVQEEV